MPVDFTNTLVIGISSRALFNLEEENHVFQTKGVEEYRKYQLEHENEILEKGTAFHLVESLLKLNKDMEERLVEVVIMSRNSSDTGLRVLNAVRHYGLDISRAAFTGGASVSPYIEPYYVDLFLSKNEDDVQEIIDNENCAAALIYDQPKNYEPDPDTVRIAFDADSVLFSDESEQIYKEKGLSAFHEHEHLNAETPLKEGPFAKLLLVLAKVQQKFLENPPIRIAIVTARSMPADTRLIKTLRNWGVHVDETHFMGGVSKDSVLKAFKAHIFFDDQDAHLRSASQVVPSSRVPYKSSSPLFVPIKKAK